MGSHSQEKPVLGDFWDWKMESSQLFKDSGVERVVDGEKNMFESLQVGKELELLKDLV